MQYRRIVSPRPGGKPVVSVHPVHCAAGIALDLFIEMLRLILALELQELNLILLLLHRHGQRPILDLLPEHLLLLALI